jgi:hypothetical protein
LLGCFRAVIQRIEDPVTHSRADDQRRRVSEAKFHQTFGRDLFATANRSLGGFFTTSFLGHIEFEVSKAKIDK